MSTSTLIKQLSIATATAALMTLGAISTPPTNAAAIRSGFNSNTLAPNDDNSTDLVSIGFDINFFGLTFDQLYVNNNGNVTFDEALYIYTPFDITSTTQQIIAPFFADVDTRGPGEPVTYGIGTVDGRDAFGVNWVDVGHYFQDLPLNSFQLVLIDRSNTGFGNFDIEFNYDQILWESGEASGGNSLGLGGESARVGFSNGTGNPGTFFELLGSGINGAFLDGESNALIDNSLNSDVPGRYVFSVRSSVPEPVSAFSLLTFGVLGIGSVLKRHSQKNRR